MPSIITRTVRATRTHLARAHSWAHQGPVRSLVAKVVMTVVGVAVIVAGLAMLLLPGPGLVVMGVGLGMLAAEWAWARRALHLVTAALSAAKEAALPADGTRRRRALGGVMIAGAAVTGFLATTATTALLGASTLL
jgi:uncharacterized protein (TIGR02611 family)